MTTAQILVTTAGAAGIALLSWFFFGPRTARRADVHDGIQEIGITVQGGYVPDRIRTGTRSRARWHCGPAGSSPPTWAGH